MNAQYVGSFLNHSSSSEDITLVFFPGVQLVTGKKGKTDTAASFLNTSEGISSNPEALCAFASWTDFCISISSRG